MGTVSVSLPSDGTTADVSDYNTPITTIVDEFNGNIDNSNIASSAAIDNAKLAGGVTGMFGAWLDYSGTSTITGWGSTTTKQFFYQEIGKTIHFAIVVTGTSNSTTTSFTLPLAASTHMAFYEGVAGLGVDNGGVLGSPVRWTIDSTNPSTLTIYTTTAGAGWTASGTKTVRITGTYEAA